jgi:hypothetical protein
MIGRASTAADTSADQVLTSAADIDAQAAAVATEFQVDRLTPIALAEAVAFFGVPSREATFCLSNTLNPSMTRGKIVVSCL